MAWRRSTPDFITGISPCAASAWGDGRLPAPTTRDTTRDPRITSHWLTGRCGSREPAEGGAQRTLHRAPCARDTTRDPRITSHWLTGRCGSREPSEGEAQRTLHHTRCAGGRHGAE